MEYSLLTLPTGPIETNAFLLINHDTDEALLFDAPPESMATVKEALAADGAKLVALMLTHGHWDHLGDLAAFQAEGIPVYAHEADRVLIEDPMRMMSFAMPGLTLTPGKIDHVIAQGDIVELAGFSMEVRHVPGHCPGNVLFYLEDDALAIVGDAIFAGSVGRTDLPGGDFDELASSIRTQIYTLPDNTALYPGHGPETTVGREKASNPFVKS